jgi:cell division protein FtsQ
VAGQRRGTQGRSPRARAAVASLPRAHKASATLVRFAPSGRSLLVGVGLLALAIGSYAIARETAVFAIDRVDVIGVPNDLQVQVQHTVAPLRGSSLLAVDGAALERRVESLPTVLSAHYDRAFPHTLRIRVVPETPVAVLHRGTETWLVSARGRVMGRIEAGTNGALARIWVKRRTTVAAGDILSVDAGGETARAVALAAHFPARIATASLAHGELVFRLRSGLELRLGAPTDVRLKLAIARRALHALPAGATYVDVSLPGRPVAGSDPQVSGGG